MGILKRITALGIAAVMLAASVSAAEYEHQADDLYNMGLFRGTENGYELERTLTRAEGATMLVRLLGQEKSVEGALPMGAFDDVPADHWAATYIEYCYREGITKGTGNNCYSPEDTISGSEYMTLVMRALGYEYVEPENVHYAAPEYRLMSSTEARAVVAMPLLMRDRMVNISYRALTTKTLSGEMLIERLITQGAVDRAVTEQLGLVEN